MIEHPEGVIVVDTGETAENSNPGRLPRYHPFYCTAVKFDVRPEQEIGPQLERLGILPSDVRTVIMTHLHSDHVAGLGHFPKSEILAHPSELAASAGLQDILGAIYLSIFPRGSNPRHWRQALNHSPRFHQAGVSPVPEML